RIDDPLPEARRAASGRPPAVGGQGEPEVSREPGQTSRSRPARSCEKEERVEEQGEGAGESREGPPEGPAAAQPLPARRVETVRQEPRRDRPGEAQRAG